MPVNQGFFEIINHFCRKLYIALKTLFCFVVIQFAWIFFRSETLEKAYLVIHQLLTKINISSFFVESSDMIVRFMPAYSWIEKMYIIILAVAIIFIGLLDFLEKYMNMEFLMFVSKCGTLLRWLMYYLMILAVMFCFVMTTNEYGQAGAFLYFQF